ncbi:hypothetical protein CSB37_02590 [bacterium DOLZORAL124_38_8]|nr:MAG: hypothetical protein CSB37_02590 [bacterium DOLZORAL124_38_8]
MDFPEFLQAEYPQARMSKYGLAKKPEFSAVSGYERFFKAILQYVNIPRDPDNSEVFSLDGVEFRVTPDMSVDDVKEAFELSLKEKKEKIALADSKVSLLDFSNKESVLNWIEDNTSILEGINSKIVCSKFKENTDSFDIFSNFKFDLTDSNQSYNNIIKDFCWFHKFKDEIETSDLKSKINKWKEHFGKDAMAEKSEIKRIKDNL